MVKPFTWSAGAEAAAAKALDEEAQELFATAERVADRSAADTVGPRHVEHAAQQLRIGRGVPRMAGFLTEAGWGFLGVSGGGLLTFWLTALPPNGWTWVCAAVAAVSLVSLGVGYTMKASSH